MGLDPDVREVLINLNHEDLLEERLIKHPLDVLRRLLIGGSAVSNEIERLSEVSLDRLELRHRGQHPIFNLAERPADPILFATEKINGYGSGVVRLHELLALSLELLLLTLQVSPNPLHPGLGDPKLISYQFLDVRTKCGIELDPLVMVLDLLFDFVDEYRALSAGCPLGVPSGAVEVGVNISRLGPGILNHQSLPALTAVHSALQEMRVLAGPLTVKMFGKDVLDPLPRDFVNKRFVSTRVVDSLVLGQPFVVRIDQDLVQVALGDGLGRQPRRRHSGQTAPGEVVGK